MGMFELGPRNSTTKPVSTSGPTEDSSGTSRLLTRSYAAVRLVVVAGDQVRFHVAAATWFLVVVSGFWPPTSWNASTFCPVWL